MGKCIAIPTHGWWLANPHTIMERRQNGEIVTSSVAFVIKGSKAAQELVNKRIKAAGVRYRVNTYTNVGPDSRSELCCVWNHIENKCCSKPMHGSYSGYHQTRDHAAGCIVKQRSHCGHTLEKYPNCKRNHIASSSRCMKKTEAAKVAQQS